MGHKTCDTCAYEKTAEVEFRNLDSHIRELKQRVGRLEQTLTRGVLLLVANLAGLIVALARGILTP